MEGVKDLGTITSFGHTGILDDLDHGTEGLVDEARPGVDPSDGPGTNDPNFRTAFLLGRRQWMVDVGY